MVELTIERITSELNALVSKMGKNMETLDYYIRLKRKENVHMYNLIKLISQYARETGDADLAVQLDLHWFCACKILRFSKVTKEICGEEVWRKIFDGLEFPTEAWTDWTQTERTDFALALQKKFLSVSSPEIYKSALEAVARTWVDKEFATTKKTVTLADLDAFIKERNENWSDDLHNQHISNDKSIIAEFSSEKWKIRREGSKIIVAQRPFLMDKYVTQNDNKMKRYYTCRCPWVRASILKEETISSSFCHCSLGYQKQAFEDFFGQRLEGKVISSALEEDATQCVFEIDIPQDIL